MVGSGREARRLRRAREIRRQIRRPRLHRFVLASGVAMLLLLLFANGLSTQTTGRSITNDPSQRAELGD